MRSTTSVSSTVSLPMTSLSRATHGSRSSREFQTGARRPPGRSTRAISGQRDRMVEPVEGLRTGDDVGVVVRQRNHLGVAEGRERAGSGLRDELQHLGQRLDRCHAMPERDERPRELSRPGADVHDVEGLVAGEPAHGFLRIPGPRRARTRPRPRRTRCTGPRTFGSRLTITRASVSSAAGANRRLESDLGGAVA